MSTPGQRLQSNLLFKDLSPDQLEKLLGVMEQISFEAGETVMTEGDPAQDLFFIKSGSVEVVKRHPETDEIYVIATIPENECIGEMALMGQENRTATIRTAEPCVLLRLSYDALRSLSGDDREIETQVIKNLAEEISKDLISTNLTVVDTLQQELESAKSRVAMGVIVNTLLTGTVFYVFAIQFVALLSREAADTTFISIPILLFFGGLSYFAAKFSGYPLSTYGVNLYRWKRSLTESLIYTLAGLALIIFVKWLLIRFHAGMAESPLFDVSKNHDFLSATNMVAIVGYILFVPIQEFVARGAIQSSFEKFMLGRYRRPTAIVVANLMFSMTHIHLSPAFAILVFIPGLGWGWLYSRHRSLLGICISHIVIGVFGFSVVGFSAMFG